MKKKRKIAILGGAFNPPTLGHVAIAKAVLKSGLVDGVHLQPCYKHIYGKEMTSPSRRLTMCKLAVEGLKGIKVSSYEINHKFSGTALEFTKKRRENKYYKNIEFYMIIGMDNANNISKWYEYKELLKILNFIVIPRKGVKPDPNVDWYLKKPHQYLKIKPSDISSTEAREAIKCGNYIKLNKLLNENVISYIKKHNLYH